MTCEHCGREIDPTSHGVWQKVEGWEHHRAAGGTNALALRRPIQAWVHGECMVAMKQGAKVNQKSLL